MSGWMEKLSQSFFIAVPAPSQTLLELQVSPSAQSALVSQGTSSSSSSLFFSPISHCPFLQASPSVHWLSFWQASPQPRPPVVFFFFFSQGRPGGQSPGSRHLAGGALPGRLGASPSIWFLMATLLGALRVPLFATMSPDASVA